MMRSVALRLSLLYLAVIMALSIGFSTAIYSISSQELVHHDPPRHILTQLDTPSRVAFENLMKQREDQGRHHLQVNLIILNTFTLVSGAILSYALARRTLEPIEEAFIAQGRFTADASHELRTPLTAMQTMIEVGLRNPKLTLSQAKELMQGSLEEVQKLSTLTNGLLKLTRSGNQDLPKKPLSVAELTKQAVEQLELAAKQKGILIATDVQDFSVLGDALNLKEALAILIDNAIKYSKSDATITVKTYEHAKFGYITVTDQGKGIADDEIHHIFDRFYRADTSRSREQVEGYGLGLSIAKKNIEAHDGSIEVKSELGKGSTFTIKLPLFKDSKES